MYSPNFASLLLCDFALNFLMHISEINIYPIKSLKGISLEKATVEERGLQYDRRWMLTAPDGMFFTQREFPRMALINPVIRDDGLLVTSDFITGIKIPFEPDTLNRQTVTIWNSVCDGLVYGDGVNEWFSSVIGTRCQLVYMPDDSRRNVNPLFNRDDNVVSFADGYPLMVLSEATLADLNSRLDVPMPMNRFRPNLVVAGSDAFAEDNWKRIRIGEAVFRSTKPCERCVITTVDQSKGEFTGKEPLKTLASYRMARDIMPERLESLGINETTVLFGQNLIAESVGAIVNVGDAIEIVQTG